MAGNMQRPSCGLCERIGADCVYPTKRKSGRRARRTATEQQRSLSNETQHVQSPKPPMTYSSDILFDAGDLTQPLPLHSPLDKSNEHPNPPLPYPTLAQWQNASTDTANLQYGEQLIPAPSFAEMADLDNVSFDSFLVDIALSGATPVSGIPSWLDENEDYFISQVSNVDTSNLQSAASRTSNIENSLQSDVLLEDEQSFTDRRYMMPNSRVPLDVAGNVASEL